MGTPSNGQLAFTDGPILGKERRPEDDDDGVERRVSLIEEMKSRAEDGNRCQRFCVCGEEGEI